MMGAKNLRQVLQKDPRKNCAYARGKIKDMYPNVLKDFQA